MRQTTQALFRDLVTGLVARRLGANLDETGSAIGLETVHTLSDLHGNHLKRFKNADGSIWSPQDRITLSIPELPGYDFPLN